MKQKKQREIESDWERERRRERHPTVKLGQQSSSFLEFVVFYTINGHKENIFLESLVLKFFIKFPPIQHFMCKHT